MAYNFFNSDIPLYIAVNTIFIHVFDVVILQGRKTVRDRKILEVHVDKGMTDGQKIVFSGEGDQEPELEPGDLVIVLDEKEHEVSNLH